MGSWSIRQREGFGHQSSANIWIARETAKKRTSGLFRRATEEVYFTTKARSN